MYCIISGGFVINTTAYHLGLLLMSSMVNLLKVNGYKYQLLTLIP